MHTQSIQKILKEQRHLWGKGGKGRKAKNSQESMKNKNKKSKKRRMEEGNNLMFNNVSKTL